MAWTRFGLLACLMLLVTGCARPERPNVLVIISDDAGYVDIGFANDGEVPTPRMDRIADEGVRFTSGYVTASVCSPSRAGLITGRYQQRFGHEFNMGGNHEAEGLGTPASERTIAEWLRDAGYRTAAFGKWHLGSVESLQPLDQGFEEFYGLLAGSRSYFAMDDDEDSIQRLVEGRTRIDEPDDLYVTDWIERRTTDFIRRASAGDEPFMAYIAFTAPHTPMDARPDDLAWAKAHYPEGTSERRLTYAAMTRALDRSVGEILDALDETGEADNTLVFFVNDNGGATNNGSDNGPYRGMKGSKWEGGIRVPFAMRWPAKVPGGRSFDEPVTTLDILATAVAAADATGDLGSLDGVDLVPFTTGRAEGSPHEILFWRRGVAAAVRQGDWKLIRSEGNPTLLFNLANDPGERNNLADTRPEKLAQLLAELEAWEAGLAKPGWSEGERWERNQVLKHRMEVDTRAEERRYP
jgi:arylsulfatase A-like enzyme